MGYDFRRVDQLRRQRRQRLDAAAGDADRAERLVHLAEDRRGDARGAGGVLALLDGVATPARRREIVHQRIDRGDRALRTGDQWPGAGYGPRLSFGQEGEDGLAERAA